MIDKAEEVAKKAREVANKTNEAVGQELKSGWDFTKGLGKKLKKGLEKERNKPSRARRVDSHLLFNL